MRVSCLTPSGESRVKYDSVIDCLKWCHPSRSGLQVRSYKMKQEFHKLFMSNCKNIFCKLWWRHSEVDLWPSGYKMSPLHHFFPSRPLPKVAEFEEIPSRCFWSISSMIMGCQEVMVTLTFDRQNLLSSSLCRWRQPSLHPRPFLKKPPVTVWCFIACVIILEGCSIFLSVWSDISSLCHSCPATDEEEEEVPSTNKKRTNSKINVTGERKVVIKHFG